MTRHVRDPVTGKCLVCEQGGHPTAVKETEEGKGIASWDDVGKKVIYVNAFSNLTKDSKGTPKKHQVSFIQKFTIL